MRWPTIGKVPVILLNDRWGRLRIISRASGSRTENIFHKFFSEIWLPSWWWIPPVIPPGFETVSIYLPQLAVLSVWTSHSPRVPHSVRLNDYRAGTFDCWSEQCTRWYAASFWRFLQSLDLSEDCLQKYWTKFSQTRTVTIRVYNYCTLEARLPGTSPGRCLTVTYRMEKSLSWKILSSCECSCFIGRAQLYYAHCLFFLFVIERLCINRLVLLSE